MSFFYGVRSSTVLLTAASAVTPTMEEFMCNMLARRVLSEGNGASTQVLSGAGRFSVDRSLSEGK
jgi:hypothetical protein